MSNWKENLNFGEITYIESEVNGVSVRFYPVSVQTLFKLKGMIQPIAKAIASFTNSTERDNAKVIRTIGDALRDDKGKPLMVKGNSGPSVIRDEETIIEAITPSLAQVREDQRQAALDNMISAVMDQKNQNVIGEIIMDSLRIPRPRPPAEEFMNSPEIPFPVMCELAIGVMKANKGVFAPVGKLLKPLWSRAESMVADKVAAPQQAESSPSQPNESEPSNQDGETSPTPSYPFPSEGTPSNS